MITYNWWQETLERKNEQTETFIGPRYTYESSEVAWFLVFTVLFTPVTAVFDILLSPLEIMIFILTKMIDRQRKKRDEE